MAKWGPLVASLKQKDYKVASKELESVQNSEELQDALQVIPFKSLNTDLPESLSILEKLYTKFVTLTNDKDEGRLIIRHVFKVDGFLANVVRTQVRDSVLGRTYGPSLDKDSVDHITQIAWSMDSTIVKELMARLTRLKSTLKRFQAGLDLPADVNRTLTSDDSFITDLGCSLAKYGSVIGQLEGLVSKEETVINGEEGVQQSKRISSWSKVQCGSCRDVVERTKKRFEVKRAVLDVVEPCSKEIDRGPGVLQELRSLVESDEKFLDVMTELCVDISCYGDIPVEKVIEQYVISYKSVLSAVAPLDEPTEYHGQRSSSLDCSKDRSLLNNGLKIDVNGSSPFRRNFDARRLHAKDKRERKEASRSLSCREPRLDGIASKQERPRDKKSDLKLKDLLVLKGKQLSEAQALVKDLKKREEELLEKFTEQAKIQLQNSEKFENISQDLPRTDSLVKRYDDLYSQLRLDALDDLDDIAAFDALQGGDEIKSQLTFAVITVSFHLAQQDFQQRRSRIFSLLSVKNDEKMASSLRNEISAQLRRSAADVDLKHVIEEVCNGLCAAMFDFPELQSCDQLRRFVEACVRFSWTICAHVPALTISSDATHYDVTVHSKSHHSNKDNNAIKHHIWPALLESDNKTVLYKGIVVT